MHKENDIERSIRQSQEVYDNIKENIEWMNEEIENEITTRIIMTKLKINKNKKSSRN